MQYNVETTSRTKERFAFALDTIYKTAKVLQENTEVFDILKKGSDITEAQIIEYKNTTSSLLKASIYTSQYIAGIHIVGRQKWQVFTSIPSVDMESLQALCAPYFNGTYATRQGNTFTGRKQINYYPGVYRGVIQYVCPQYNLGDGTMLGVIVIDIDYGVLEEMFLSFSKKDEDKALIARSNGDIIFNYPYNITLNSVLEDYPLLLTEKSSQFSGEVFGAEMLIVSDTIDYTDWHIVRMISLNRITKDTQSIQALMARVALIFTILSIGLSILMARILTAQMTRLTNAFQQAEQGDLNARMIIRTKDELGKLGESFNLMMRKLNDYFNKELESQRKKSEMELQVLQAQVNPHFLYNTLDSIKWLAMLQSVNNIAEMTTALIHLLRYNLSKDGPVVTLKDEISSVENYICVQKYRYGDGIVLEKELSSNTLSCLMLRFILQPLVENCIVHAFGHMDSLGVIRIESDIQGETLHVRVIDNGEGMDIDRVFSTEEEKGTRFKNIGINNISERIKLYYGPDYGLTYQSTTGTGSTADVSLPVCYGHVGSAKP
jgi:two-component system sensor histidine kinase YesM